MKHRKSVAAIGAVTLVGTGAFLLPAVASPHTATHTLTFTAVALHNTNFTKTESGQIEKDVVKGKIIGYDVLHFRFNPKTHTGSGGVTLDTIGGFLYGTLNVNTNGPVIHGKVTGGTGKFKGVTGTILGKDLNKAGTRTAVTITYHH